MKCKEQLKVKWIKDKEQFKLHKKIFRWHNKRKLKSFTKQLETN